MSGIKAGVRRVALEREREAHRTETVGRVNIVSDGHGEFQARCTTCGYRGPWRRLEPRAVDDAQAHSRAMAARTGVRQ